MSINEASAIRRREDVKKLLDLQAKMPHTLLIKEVSGEPAQSIKIEINIPTAKNANYPHEKQDISSVVIKLPEAYPFPPGPTVIFNTTIWNPNVYKNGQWCFGDWEITENLELFVTRLMKVVALDPTIINPRSPANIEAANWYVKLNSNQPRLFPTVVLSNMMVEPKPREITWGRKIK